MPHCSSSHQTACRISDVDAHPDPQSPPARTFRQAPETVRPRTVAARGLARAVRRSPRCAAFITMALAVHASSTGCTEQAETRTAEAGIGDRLASDSGTAPDAIEPGPYEAPRYEDGALVRVPETEWRRWVFLGAGLNMNYAGAFEPETDVFSTVYMEPSAYAHYMDHGEFREGTMTALAIYAAGESAAPLKSGLFADEPLGFEMSVKDSDRLPDEVWGYYTFPGRTNLADPNPAQACQQCHADHAETDLVFTQFYTALP